MKRLHVNIKLKSWYVFLIKVVIIILVISDKLQLINENKIKSIYNDFVNKTIKYGIEFKGSELK
ncbi:MAG: hypothetical protein ACQEQF_00505 [Bacillota bacterium]